ncbi:response regulator transcription factor [Lentibacillus saliphilus]|uniref:response regulator transcription factor n=1 Tax=Lentibacillus saliphilus TaxID=2737028 RepID=UPI001C2FC050|nr:response regulator transcription factor [Lentibacillus saliphilus]
MTKVLLIDDEPRMLDLLELYLAPHGYTCKKMSNSLEALDHLESYVYDLVLLDVMMPEMDGWTLGKKIRTISDVPIIMITALDQHEDIVKGLKLGADDYITKPLNEQELLARIEAVLRRSGSKTKVELNGLVWNETTFTLSFKNEPIKLTPKEFSMVGYLMKNPEQVFSREKLIELIWGLDSYTGGRTIDSHVRNVREKIRVAGFPVDDHFKTVWGVGYKWTNQES